MRKQAENCVHFISDFCVNYLFPPRVAKRPYVLQFLSPKTDGSSQTHVLPTLAEKQKGLFK